MNELNREVQVVQVESSMVQNEGVSAPPLPPSPQPLVVLNARSMNNILFIYAFFIVFFFAIVILFGVFGKKSSEQNNPMSAPSLVSSRNAAIVEQRPPTPPVPEQYKPLNLTGSAAVSSWKKINFTTFKNQKVCNGDRYIGYSERYLLWVGAELCNTVNTYKLYMSDSENGIYLQIADTNGNGQDHCELINSNFSIPNSDDIKSGSCSECALGEMVDVQNEPVYVRDGFGEAFKIQDSKDWSDLTVKSYTCGVPIGSIPVSGLAVPEVKVTETQALE